MSKYITVVLLLLSLNITAQNTSDSLHQKLSTLYEQGYINGFAVAVVNEEGVLFSQGYGYVDVAQKKNYSINTIQNIGSISKTFIGLALLKAQEEEKLNLDDPINDYLPFKIVNPHAPDVLILIRHLATHTSGIKDTKYYDKSAYILMDEQATKTKKYKGIDSPFHPPSKASRLEDYLKNFLTKDGDAYKKKNFIPLAAGSRFEYSNIASALAAYIIERATGVSFSAYTQQHILKPLNMQASGWFLEEVEASQHSVLYAKNNIPLPEYRLITYPDGGLISSVEDLSKYLIELIRAYGNKGTLLSENSYKTLFTPSLEEQHFSERNLDFAYSDEYNTSVFMGFTPNGNIGHTGSDPGVLTFMFFDPKTALGRIVLLNSTIHNKEGVEQFYTIWETLKNIKDE